MKRLSTFVLAGGLALSAFPAWAQQIPPPTVNAGPGYGYYGMWHHGWGWHPGMFLAPFVLLLALIGTVALIVWLVRWINAGYYQGWQHHGHRYPYGPHPGPGRAALDILEERFARGEIDKAEFEEKRKLIGR